MPEYRQLPGYSAYQIGDDGSVQTRWRKGPRGSFVIGEQWRNLSLVDAGQGYLTVNLYSDEHRKRMWRVHRLVATAFLPNPDGLPLVRHMNGTRQDNRLVNLMWGTAVENYADSIRHGTAYREPPPPMTGADHPASKLSANAAVDIFVGRDLPGTHFQAKYGVTNATVSAIRCGVSWAPVIRERIGDARFFELVSPGNIRRGKAGLSAEQDRRRRRANGGAA